MAKRKQKAKSRTVTAKVIGPVPRVTGSGFGWMVRMAAPYLPFYLDSAMSFSTKERADAVTEKWKRKTVQITVTSE